MDRLHSACNKLQELINISGKNAKQAFIYKNAYDQDFLNLILYRLDIFKVYKITKLPVIPYTVKPTLTYDMFISLLDNLNTCHITDAARLRTNKLIHQADYKIGDILIGIVTKSLSLGIDTGVNKALMREFIPTFDVMLAASLQESYEYAGKPVIVEKKIDGVRCIALVKNGICSLYTRNGRLLSFPKLEREFSLFANMENMMFDMELELSSRTGISGVCNSNLKTGYAENSDDNIIAYTFDEMPLEIFLSQGKTKLQKARSNDLQVRHANFSLAKRIQLVETQTVHSYDKIMEISNGYIAAGFEGVIVKDISAPYHFKRNKAWLKVKSINSCTLKVVGIELGSGKRLNKVGSLICESSCGGVRVKVGSGFTDEDIELFTQKPPIGMNIEVLFNVLIRGSGSDVYSCFLPRYKEMRLDVEADSLEKIKLQHIGKIEVCEVH